MQRYQFKITVDTQFDTHRADGSIYEISTFFRIVFAAMRYQHTRLAAIRIGYGKRQGIANANFGLLFGQVFKVLRPDVLAVDNDQVFLATGDDQAAVDKLADIARVEPALFRQHLASFQWRVEVTGGDAAAAQKDGSAAAFTQDVTRVITNLNGIARQGFTTLV